MPRLTCPFGVAMTQWCVHVFVATRFLLDCMTNPVGFGARLARIHFLDFTPSV